MAKKYQDNSIAPIVAIDFDGTIGIGADYPECGTIRPFAKEVINFLTDIGIKVVIWTSRDIAVNQEELKVYDDLTPMINFLAENGVRYSAINKSIQFAPFHYNTRKVYAHMYVDDRGYGWVESQFSLIYALNAILTDLCGASDNDANAVCAEISRGELRDDTIIAFRDYIKSSWC